MEILAYITLGIICLFAVLQVRNIIGIAAYILMVNFGWCKRWFIPMKTTKAMTNMLNTLMNTIETDKSVKVSLHKRILVVEQENCETVYILVDPRSAFFGCCVTKDCRTLIFQEMPSLKATKRLSKLVDSMFGETLDSPIKSITPERF